MPQLSFQISPELDNDLEHIAGFLKRSKASVAQEAVEILARRQAARIEFLNEGLAALDELRTTGKHVTHEEVEQWVDAVLDGKEAELPEPHL